jgi:threonyl-tRNA synthetase
MLVIGDKEINSENLNVRDRGAMDTREIAKDKFISEVLDKIKNRS